MGLRRVVPKLKGHAGDVLQVAGAVGLTVTAAMYNGFLGGLVGSVLAVVAGVVVERS